MTVYTSKGGTSSTPLNWSQSSTWTVSGSGTPRVYKIRSSDYIYLDTGNATSSLIDSILIYGNLLVGNNVTLNLSSSGIVSLLNSSAKISSGSNNSIFKWNSTSGTISGPFTANREITNGPRYATASTAISAGGDPQGSFISAALPLEVSEFTAACNNGALDIEWTTTSESNADYFVILLSADGSQWHTINTMSATGIQGAPTHYSYSYGLAQEAGLGYKVYLKLKVVEKSSLFTQYNATTNTCSPPVMSNSMELGLTPNPSLESTRLTIKNADPGQVNVSLYSRDGKLCRQFTLVAENQKDISVLIYNLNLGVYIVKVESANQNQLITLVRQ